MNLTECGHLLPNPIKQVFFRELATKLIIGILDFSKTFDKVPHTRLPQKIISTILEVNYHYG